MFSKEFGKLECLKVFSIICSKSSRIFQGYLLRSKMEGILSETCSKSPAEELYKH